MYDKSFQLVKKVSELVPEEGTKIKGNSEYYLNKDNDYMDIIDKQIDSLTNHFRKNNFNLGYKTDSNIDKNNNNIPKDENNNITYGEYKNNLLQRIKNINNNINDNGNNIDNNNKRNYINDYLNNKKKENIEVNILYYNNNIF